jgi:Bifunctional DNA primase/polymerase, N-terminal/AAA domain
VISLTLADVIPPSDARVAVTNAGLGFQVIPYRLDGSGKKPCIKGWQHRGSTDPFELDEWFHWEFVGRHPGVVTGPGSNVWVLDIDRHGADDGFETLAKLEAEYGPLPRTFTIRTPRDGEHRYFRWPTDGTVIKTRAGADPGIDTKGLGGFAAAPGSQNGAGRYEVVLDVPIVEAPDWIVQRYRRDERERVEVDPRAREDAGCVSVAREALTRRELDLAATREGGRNSALNRAAFMLGQLGAHGLIDEATARSALVNGACAVNGLLFEDGREACDRTFDSGWSAGLDEPAALFDGGITVENMGDRLCDAGSWALDEPEQIPAVWGRGEEVLWSEGEPTTIAGGQGAGKTTLAQRLVLSRIGVYGDEPMLLGYPVARDDRPVLYLAMDRPRQAARSLRRMFGEEHRALVDARLKVWRGPLPFDLMERPARLAEWASDLVPGCGTLVLDSVKDLVPGISKD